MEEQGPLFADQMAPYKEKSLSQGSGPARPTSKAWAPLTPEMQAEFDAYNAQQRAAAAAEKVRWDGVLAANKAANDARYGTGWDAPSRWPAPNQPDTSNNYQQPQLTYGPRQTAETGWVPSPQPQSSQFGFDYGPPPQMSDRVSRLAGAGAPAKVPAWMTAGNKQYLLQRNR
jgi:hypothetical protein